MNNLFLTKHFRTKDERIVLSIIRNRKAELVGVLFTVNIHNIRNFISGDNIESQLIEGFNSIDDYKKEAIKLLNSKNESYILEDLQETTL